MISLKIASVEKTIIIPFYLNVQGDGNKTQFIMLGARTFNAIPVPLRRWDSKLFTAMIHTCYSGLFGGQHFKI